MKRFGLIGKTLGHSFSKGYFEKKFAQLQLGDHTYENYEIAVPEVELPALKLDPSLCGLNITIPYKGIILSFADEISSTCRALGAANCIKVRNGQWIAHNTDVIGFERSFTPLLKPHHQKALVLGTGGASAAVKYVLNRLQIPFLVVSRTASPKSITYAQVTAELLAEHTILINTTPLGMHPHVLDKPLLPYEALSPMHYLYDLIYNPAETAFLGEGKRVGATTKNGLEMLEIQAEESWKIWTVDPV